MFSAIASFLYHAHRRRGDQSMARQGREQVTGRFRRVSLYRLRLPPDLPYPLS